MIKSIESDGVLHVAFPGQWDANNLDDLRAIESWISTNYLSKVSVDLSHVNVLNIAIIWLYGHIRKKCAEAKVSFEIKAANHLFRIYLGESFA